MLISPTHKTKHSDKHSFYVQSFAPTDLCYKANLCSMSCFTFWTLKHFAENTKSKLKALMAPHPTKAIIPTPWPKISFFSSRKQSQNCHTTIPQWSCKIFRKQANQIRKSGGGGEVGVGPRQRGRGPFQTCFFCSTMAVSNLDRLSPCLLDRDRELDLELDRLRELDRLCLRFLSDPDPRRLLDDLLTWQPSWAGIPMLLDKKNGVNDSMTGLRYAGWWIDHPITC